MDGFKKKEIRKKRISKASLDEMGQEVQEVLSKRRLDRNWSMKIKRNPQTESLFHDTSRLIRNLDIIGSFEFKRVKCYAKNSSVIYLPAEYDDPVLFTNIERDRVSLKNILKSKSTAWMTVMTRFYHEKIDFDVSEIIKVQKPWFGRRFASWVKRKARSSDAPVCLNTYVYPDKKCIRVPREDLERNCQLCDSPSMRCYKSLSKAVTEEVMPFILTIPFDPFTRSVQKATNRRNTKTSYFEKLIIDSVETLDVFLTYFNDDTNITAVVIPEDVSFNVEQISTGLPRQESKTHGKVSEEELLEMYEKLEPLVMKLEDVNDITLIDLEVEDETDRKPPGKKDFFEEFEMQCIVKYKAHIKRSDSSRYSSYDENVVPNKHSYYNMADPMNPENKKNATPSTTEADVFSDDHRDKTGNDRTPEEVITLSTSTGVPGKHSYCKVLDEVIPEGESDEEEVEMASFDDDGHITIHEKRSSTSNNNNDDYLSPLTDFTLGYSRFKKAMRASLEHEHQVSGDIVIGKDGYVQVSEKEKQEKKDKKKAFWKRKKNYGAEEEQELERKEQKRDDIQYYEPMYGVDKEKPAVPAKSTSLKLSPPISEPIVQDEPIKERTKPGIPPKSKRILQYKHSSMKPLLESFDEEDTYTNINLPSKASFKRKSAAGLNSRINYFEAKSLSFEK